MSETSIKSAQFVTADQIIKGAMIDMGESSNHMYTRFMSWLQEGYDEMNFDVLKTLKEKYLPVDATTKSVQLPIDCVNATRVGLINQGNEIQDIAYNSNIAFTPITQNCETSHCDCGCGSSVCELITNQTTTTEDIVINGTTYQKTTTICTDEEGNIKAHICTPVVTNTKQECDYSITITAADGNPLVPKNMPWSTFKFHKNGSEILVGDVATKAVLQSVMTANGYTEDGLTLVWSIIDTPDIWTSVTYFDNSERFTTTTFTQSNCDVPTPSVSTICYDEIICETTVAGCGCVTLSNKVIDTLSQWGTLFQEFISRDLKGLDWQQSLKQPLSWFGYYNVDYYNRVLQLDQSYPFDTVFLQYYSAQEVDGGEFLVPILASKALKAYIKWMYVDGKPNVTDREKMRRQKHWINEKKKTHERRNPLNIANLLDNSRMNSRP